MLFNKKNTRTSIRDCSKHRQEVPNNEGCQSQGQLINQQQSRLGGRASREHDHLLLASRQESGLSTEEGGKFGKQFQSALHIASTETQIVENAQASDNGWLLRGNRNTSAHSPVKGVRRGLAFKIDFARQGRNDSDNPTGSRIGLLGIQLLLGSLTSKGQLTSRIESKP
jgi:hypothetical protein